MYSSNEKSYAHTTTIPMQLYRLASSWLNCEKTVHTTESKNRLICYVASSKCDQMLLNDFEDTIERYENLQWSDFNEFVSIRFSLYKVEIECSNWRDSKCTCKYFFKEYMCKHIIGLAAKHRLFKLPREANNQKISSKAKRGRPALAKKALFKQ